MIYFAAQDRAKALARGGDSDATPSDLPATVGKALTAYAEDLKARNSDPYNASRSRVHLPARLLATPVALLMSKELKDWRNSLNHRDGTGFGEPPYQKPARGARTGPPRR